MHRRRYSGRRVTWAVLVPAVTLVLAGCGDGDPEPTASRGAATATPATAKATTTQAPAPSSAPPETARPEDGRRLTACADAKCHVEVKAGDVIHFNSRSRRKTRFRDLTVKSIGQNKVVYTMASGGATFTQPGPNRPANVNGISLTLLRANDGRAVIRIAGPIRGALTVEVGPGGGMRVVTPGG